MDRAISITYCFYEIYREYPAANKAEVWNILQKNEDYSTQDVLNIQEKMAGETSFYG